MFKYIAIACLLGVAAGAPSYGAYAGYSAIEHDAYPRYGFNYAVSDPHTGDHKAQSEHRDGGHVKGSYSVAEPDGTLRVVDYSADPHSGFNAVVKRIGHAHHPHHVAPIVAPAYSTGLVGIGWGGLGHGLAGHGAGLGAWGGHGAGLGAWGGHGAGLGAWASHGAALGAWGGHGAGLGAWGDHGLGLGLGHGHH